MVVVKVFSKTDLAFGFHFARSLQPCLDPPVVAPSDSCKDPAKTKKSRRKVTNFEFITMKRVYTLKKSFIYGPISDWRSKMLKPL